MPEGARVDRLTRIAAPSSSPSARRSRSTRFRPARSATPCSRCRITCSRATVDRVHPSAPDPERSRDGDIARAGHRRDRERREQRRSGWALAWPARSRREAAPRSNARRWREGPVEPGGCVATSAGRLPARYVIHAAVMGQDLAHVGGNHRARDAMRAARPVNARGVASMAFPAFGTGVGGFPVAECARIMIGAIRDHAPAAPSLRLIRLVLFGAATYRTFAEVAADLPTRRSTGRRIVRCRMSPQPEDRLRELRDAIRHHEECYYIHNAPEVSDEEFDRLLHELERLEAEHPDLVTPDSPTQRVAGQPHRRIRDRRAPASDAQPRQRLQRRRAARVRRAGAEGRRARRRRRRATSRS